MKKLLISPYFGKLPNYFQLFLDSCGLNSNFTDFLIVTDDVKQFEVPKNVQIVVMSFTEFNDLVKQKLGPEFLVTSPYKICDYRPAFGRIFENYLEGYDFWGHVDTDMILGKLSNFLPESAFAENDRLLERGALMFYANKSSVNKLFLQELGEIINFTDAIKIEEPCFYDEIMFPALFRRQGHKTYSNTTYADILPQSLEFTIDGHCKIQNLPGQYFVYRHGVGLFQGVGDKENVAECMYLHIQKRPMKVKIDDIPPVAYLQENCIVNEKRLSKITKKDKLSWRLNYLKRQLKKFDWNHIKIHLKTRAVRRRIQW